MRPSAAALVLLVAVAARPAAAQELRPEPAPPPALDPATAAPPVAAAPDSQPLVGPLLKGKSLQPGDAGYKSMAWAAAFSFGATILPALVGGFLTRARGDGVMWTGMGLIYLGQSFGPSTGYWYANERPRFTWYRLMVSTVALAAAGYPLYAYTGRVSGANTGAAAALVTIAVVAEAVALGLAAWELTLLGDAIDRHNERPAVPPASRPAPRRAAAPVPVPLLMPGGGGLGLQGVF